MKLRIVSASRIAEDNAAIKASQDSQNPLSRSQRFNTTHHAHDEIVKVVPESTHFTHAAPPWAPYGYTIWHELIARSQELTDYHVFNIPSFLYEDLMLVYASWLCSGTVSAPLVERITEDWVSTKSGKTLAALLDGGKKRWFIRLDQMSPKDSPLGGDLPSSTFNDIITKICSSMRAYGCLQSAKQDAERDGDGLGPKMQLILNPWNDNMDPAKEFRVFVPPPAARGILGPHTNDFKVSGISQYKWHSALQSPPGSTGEWVMDCISEGAQRMLADITSYTGSEVEADMKDLLLRHGFSFDIALQDNGSVQLVEINPFGAMSGCGACLFQWVVDGRVLYGLEECEIAMTLEVSEQTAE
jgi:hypothetical protein